MIMYTKRISVKSNPFHIRKRKEIIVWYLMQGQRMRKQKNFKKN